MQMSVEELIQRNNSAQKVNRVEEVETNNNNTAPAAARTVSIEDLAKTLPGKPVEEIVDENTTPLLNNAFSSMTTKLEEKKKHITEEILPIVYKNAEEIAAEEAAKAHGLSDVEESISDEVDEFDSIMEDDTTVPEELTVAASEIIAPTLVTTEPVMNIAETMERTPVAKTVPAAGYEISKSDFMSEANELIDELEEDDDEEDFLGEETDEELQKRLQNQIKISPIKNPIDLSTFTLSKRPSASANVILSSIEAANPVKAADWALMGSNMAIRMVEAKGPELEALHQSIRASNEINAAIASLRFAYNHIQSADKPDFETWSKMIRVEDVESLYFALYRATYFDANFIGYTDEKEEATKDHPEYGCGKTSIVEVDINKMPEFEKPEDEELFKKIMAKDTTNAVKPLKSTLLMVSDDLAISYEEATVYNTLIQFSTLNEKTIAKYSDLLNMMAYINGFYKIDRENRELVPIEHKVYRDNIAKTIAEKLKIFNKILLTLTIDQHDMLTVKLNSLNTKSKVSYVLPETACPECGNMIKKHQVPSMLDLLFTRRQLAAIKSLS